MSRADQETAPEARTADAAPAAAAPPRAPYPPRRALHPLTLLRSELSVMFRRWRTLTLLGLLAALPIVIGIAVRAESSDSANGGGPAFVAQVAGNGLFLVFTSLAVTLPVFLPLAVGVVVGDSVAGEAGGGTLRYLLVAPAGRSRLLAVKFVSGVLFCLAATATVAAVALLAGAALFPLHRVTLLSGTTIGTGDTVLRAVLVALAVAASLVGVCALGLFVSTLTGSGIAAMATTVGVVVIVQVLDQIPQLHAIQPWLFPHYWLSFADLLRDPVQTHDIGRNLGLQALYGAFFGSAAWVRLTLRDITS